jgi:hypothetical protein
MYAQLRGNNQGIIKVTTNGIARTPGYAGAPPSPWPGTHAPPPARVVGSHTQRSKTLREQWTDADDQPCAERWASLLPWARARP